MKEEGIESQMQLPVMTKDENAEAVQAGVFPGGTTERVNFRLIVCFFVYAFLLMLFCTKSSPLFPVNDWYDANVYFTMGKGLMHGYVPYVDLIDNKGPLLYLLYGLASLIDPRGFTGVYVIQSLLLGVSVLFTYKLVGLFVRSELCAVFAALLSPALMLTSRLYADAFNFGGGGPDEFCRALMTVALYYFTLFFLKHEGSVTGYKPWHTALLGGLLACVFMLKFNYATFWVGFLIAAAVCLRKQRTELVKHIALFLAGSLLCAVPYVIYAVSTGSLGAFFEEYLFYNASYAASVTPSVDATVPFVKAFFCVGGFAFFILGTLLPALCFISGSVFVVRRTDKRYKLGYILSFAFLFLATYLARVFPFTSIPVTVFCLMGLVAAARLAERILPKLRLKRTVLTVFATLAVFIFTVTDNNLVEFLAMERTDGIPDFRQRIAETIGEDEDPHLLELMSLDSGIYTVCGIIPDTPYFYKPNIDHAVYPDALEAQHEIIANKQTDYAVVTLVNDKLPPGAYSEEETRYEEKILATLRKNYDFVEKYSATGFQAYRQYYLYKVKEG